MGFVARVCQPSTLRMLICPEASSAQNIIAAVSDDGSTVWVLIRRLNSSCNRSIALVVRRLRHWLCGRRAQPVREGGRAKSSRRAGADGRVHARRPRWAEGFHRCQSLLRKGRGTRRRRRQEGLEADRMSLRDQGQARKLCHQSLLLRGTKWNKLAPD